LEKNELPFHDQHLHYICPVWGKLWLSTKNSKIIHDTWDLYSDKNNEYTKIKNNPSCWETPTQSNFTIFSKNNEKYVRVK